MFQSDVFGDHCQNFRKTSVELRGCVRVAEVVGGGVQVSTEASHWPSGEIAKCVMLDSEMGRFSGPVLRLVAFVLANA